MDPEHPFSDSDAGGVADVAACVPADVALDPELLGALAGRLQALAGDVDASEASSGLRLIGPPTPAALAAVEGPGARSGAAIAMDRLARVCADYASAAALRDCGMGIDRELGWLRRETIALGYGAARSIRELTDADESGADGIGSRGRPAA